MNNLKIEEFLKLKVDVIEQVFWADLIKLRKFQLQKVGDKGLKMKEIKFRAWGVDGESPIKMWSWEYIREDFDIWLDDKKAVIMQYTGLKDSNNKDIYEGDIVKYEDGVGDLFVAEVWWDGFGFNLYEHGKLSDVELKEYEVNRINCEKIFINVVDVEVIGNIYENSELLKESEEE